MESPFAGAFAWHFGMLGGRGRGFGGYPIEGEYAGGCAPEDSIRLTHDRAVSTGGRTSILRPDWAVLIKISPARAASHGYFCFFLLSSGRDFLGLAGQASSAAPDF